MAANLFEGESSRRVRVENFGDQVFALGGYVRWKGVLAIQYFLVQFVCVWIFKREVSAEHSVQDNATGPDVNFQPVVVLASYHFWSCVARTAASSD